MKQVDIIKECEIPALEIKEYAKGNKKLIFVLRGYQPSGVCFITYASYNFSHCCQRLIDNEREDLKMGVKNSYKITLEGGY